jgi:hypothetical protein
MFCPECGMEDRQANQFCRACGTDLRRVRVAVESPDGITASAMSAREELGRAVAMKIREIQGAEELAAVTEDVLPEIEKFLESPEEKRLRRMRTGMILSSIGLGAAVGITAISAFMKDQDVIFLAGLGIVAFFIGLGFILNGMFLTVPRRGLGDKALEADRQRMIDATGGNTSDMRLPDSSAGSAFTSVTENTTQHLTDKQPEPGKRN